MIGYFYNILFLLVLKYYRIYTVTYERKGKKLMCNANVISIAYLL